MKKFTKILLLFFISAVLSDGLEGKNQDEQKFIDATYGQTPVSESNARHSSELKASTKRQSSSSQSQSDTFYREEKPFFTTEENGEEKAAKLKPGSMSSISSDSFDSRSNDFPTTSSSTRPLASSSSSGSDSFSFSDSSTSSSSSSSNNWNRRRPRRLTLDETVNRITYQRPWCPGQALASIIPIASEPVYRWLETTQTCQEFAKRFGNLYISVNNEENVALSCEYVPDGGSMPSSDYTVVRSMALNRPIYAAIYDPDRDTTFALASGIIFERDGIILSITIAKQVSDLPQICSV